VEYRNQQWALRTGELLVGFPDLPGDDGGVRCSTSYFTLLPIAEGSEIQAGQFYEYSGTFIAPLDSASLSMTVGYGEHIWVDYINVQLLNGIFHHLYLHSPQTGTPVYREFVFILTNYDCHPSQPIGPIGLPRNTPLCQFFLPISPFDSSYIFAQMPPRKMNAQKTCLSSKEAPAFSLSRCTEISFQRVARRCIGRKDGGGVPSRYKMMASPALMVVKFKVVPLLSFSCTVHSIAA
jgi:hypothetical protein